ncbi:uncharacterized protein METZ01_LOCUS115712, partial [marine metagenome]
NLSNPQQDISVGAGVNMGGISANFAMTMTQYFDNVMRFGIGYSF